MELLTQTGSIATQLRHVCHVPLHTGAGSCAAGPCPWAPTGAHSHSNYE